MTTLKRPIRTGKPYAKRALVYARQYDYKRRKSALYQEAIFYTHGAELGLITASQALSQTVAEFNSQYGDTLTYRHGLLVLMLKYYILTTKTESFNAEDIRTFFDLKAIFGSLEKQTGRLIADLARLDFCNPLKFRFAPTQRIKVFCAAYEKTLKNLFQSLH